MTLAHRLAFAHDLRELMSGYQARFIYDEFPTTGFQLGDETIANEYYKEARYFWITYDEDDRDGEWEVDGGFGWEVAQHICNSVLDGKIKFINEPEPSERPRYWSPPQQKALLLYIIDKDSVGKWVVRGWAYDTKEKEEGRYGQATTKDFQISDEAFYELLAKAEASVEK